MSILFYIFSIFFFLCVHSTTYNINPDPNLVGSSRILFIVSFKDFNVDTDTVVKIKVPPEYTLSNSSFYCSFIKGMKTNNPNPNCQQLSGSGENELIFTTVTNDVGELSFCFGYYKHTGVSNKTGSFEMTVLAGQKQYTMHLEAQLKPPSIESNKFFFYC